jgi:hypothetical protein
MVRGIFTMSRGLKPGEFCARNVWAEAQTYLTSRGHGLTSASFFRKVPASCGYCEGFFAKIGSE